MYKYKRNRSDVWIVVLSILCTSNFPFNHFDDDDNFYSAVIEGMLDCSFRLQEINNKIFTPFEINDSFDTHFADIGRIRLGRSDCKYSLVRSFFLFDWSSARIVPNLPSVRIFGRWESRKKLKSRDTKKQTVVVRGTSLANFCSIMHVLLFVIHFRK